MFVDRVAEIAFLNRVLGNEQHPGPGQLVMLYGRRRVGKSTLLRHWAEQSGMPFTYWVAEKEPAAVQRRKLFALLIGADPAAPGAPVFASWSDLWQAAAAQFQHHRRLLILDELPYAAEADPAMLSALQHAWDQHCEHSYPAGQRISWWQCTRWSVVSQPTCRGFEPIGRCWRMCAMACWRRAVWRSARCCFCSTTNCASRAPT